jgi:NAD(P)-dependent dehydrogenase (short-subunit alcohol dehydrogenase family)
MDLRLQGKAAIVSGGSRGIGKAVAMLLAREGVDVAIAARDMAALQAAAAEIAGATGRKVIPIATDTGDDAKVREMVGIAAAGLGRIDILVNAAAQPGGQSGKPPGLADISWEMLAAEMNTKVMGYMRTAREVVPYMKAQGWGRIINISGLAARNTGSIVGSVRNVGVSALTKNMADELGPYGINVTCVHPAVTRTEKTPAVMERMARAQGVPIAAIEKQMGSKNVLGRIIDAEEVADVIGFLASPRSVSINGDSIAVGGGSKGSIHY